MENAKDNAKENAKDNAKENGMENESQIDTLSLNGADWQFKGFIGEDWLLRNAHLPDTHDVRGWQSATVPGSVQHDLWQAGLIPDPYFEQNSLQIEWVPQRTWLYKKTFTVDPTLRGKRIQLIFQGVDYSARFFLNGEPLGQQVGMFLPAAFDVDQRLNYDGPNYLAVVIDPAPFEQPQIGYTSRVSTQKSRMGYWWDFCPRLINVGLFEDVFLRISGPARLEDVYVQPRLSDDLLSADVDVTVRLDQAADTRAEVEIRLYLEGEEEDWLNEFRQPLADGQPEIKASLHIDQPELWWPNGCGEPALYSLQTRVWVDGQLSDARSVTFGIRRVEFVPNDGAAAGSLPYNLVVNGRKIYIQGWNWVPMDALYGVDLPYKRKRLMRLARNAHVNLLRVWGGGLIEKEAFYDFCDRYGILVWQEFIQSSSGIDNFPSDDPEYIQTLLRTAEQAIRARRNHASLAVWCGGNELHYGPTDLCNDRTPALAALADAVKRLDPGRHWVPTSPAGGVFTFAVPQNEAEAQAMQDVHGPWEYQGQRKQYELYNQGRSLLHSEFGVEGLTNRRSLNLTIAPEHQWPVSLDNPLWHHLGAWWVKESVWQAVFGGPFKSVEMARQATQFMQADGLRYAVEADRRRMYQNGGSMPWQFNEPYPMAACTSAVDYFAEPKPVYFTVRRAYKPLTLSARFDTLAWGGETDFSAEIWYANAGEMHSSELSAQVVALDGRVLCDINQAVICAENQSGRLAVVQMPLEQIKGDLFLLDMALWDADGDLAANNRYLFSRTENLAPLLSSQLFNGQPTVHLRARVEKMGKFWEMDLENPSNQTALWIWLEIEKPDLRGPGYAYFSDNYFCLLPGEQRTIQVEWSGMRNVPGTEHVVTVSGWNVHPIRISGD